MKFDIFGVRMINWFLVILWMALIFFLSHQSGLRSPFEPRIDFVLRKLAHMTEYFILTLLFFRAFGSVNKAKAVWLAVFCSLLYAISDEWHQSFIEARSGSARDVLIDGLGISGAFFLKRKINRKIRFLGRIFD